MSGATSHFSFLAHGSRVTRNPMGKGYDALIVGGGHNGLVCAFYLARAGLKVRVLERRSVVGGAAVTEEFHPGFRNSTASYTVSLLQPKVIADMRLAERGYRVIERPIANFLPLDERRYLKIGGGLNILCEFVAVAIFIARLWPTALRSSWGAPTGQRHIAFAAIVIPFSMGILVYLIVLAASSSDPTAVPTGLLIAFDHSVFIGVITNVTFGLIFALTDDVPTEAPWLRHTVFVGMNAGLLIFLIGLIAESSVVKEIGSPIMGISILVGIGILARRLLGSNLEAVAAD